MPKVRIYTQTELNEMTRGDLLKTVQREAERLNKQITRYKARGAVAGDVIPSSSLKRLPVSSLKNMSERQLMRVYQQAQERTTFGGLTKSGISKARERKSEIAKELNTSEENISAEDLQKLHHAIEQAETENAAFYEVLTRAVEEGIEEDTQFFRTTSEAMYEQTKTAEGRREFMSDTIKRINKAVRDKNKQARENGITDRKRLAHQFSMKQATARAKKRAISKTRK